MSDRRRRRASREDLPTKLEQSFEDMDDDDKNRLQKLGGWFACGGVLLPLVGGLLRELSLVYWIFSGLVFTVGILLLWPRLGVYVLTSAPGAIAKLVPHRGLRKQLEERVDRRAPREDPVGEGEG